MKLIKLTLASVLLLWPLTGQAEAKQEESQKQQVNLQSYGSSEGWTYRYYTEPTQQAILAAEAHALNKMLRENPTAAGQQPPNVKQSQPDKSPTWNTLYMPRGGGGGGG